MWPFTRRAKKKQHLQARVVPLRKQDDPESQQRPVEQMAALTPVFVDFGTPVPVEFGNVSVPHHGNVPDDNRCEAVPVPDSSAGSDVSRCDDGGSSSGYDTGGFDHGGGYDSCGGYDGGSSGGGGGGGDW